MQSTPKEQRDSLRQSYEKKFTEKANVMKHIISYAGRDFEYYVFPAAAAPANLQMAAAQFTPDLAEWAQLGYDSKEVFFAVSDAVPTMFRKFWILHEVIEFVHGIIEGGCQCVTASTMEAALVCRDAQFRNVERLEYFLLRQRFFTDLMTFAKEMKLDGQTILIFQDSLQFFSRMAACPLLQK